VEGLESWDCIQINAKRVYNVMNKAEQTKLHAEFACNSKLAREIMMASVHEYSWVLTGRAEKAKV
jgi:hypothetical protein